MCKAFSCLVDKNKKVIWRLDIDSHDKLVELAGYKNEHDTTRFVRVEISPRNNNYLQPDKWVFKIDEQNVPDWWSPAHKEKTLHEFRKYKKQLYQIVIKNQLFILSMILNLRVRLL